MKKIENFGSFLLAVEKEVKAMGSLGACDVAKQHKPIIRSFIFVCHWTFSTLTQNRFERPCEDSHSGNSVLKLLPLQLAVPISKLLPLQADAIGVQSALPTEYIPKIFNCCYLQAPTV